jgi:DNA-binding HxlR family transcriptional regulator
MAATVLVDPEAKKKVGECPVEAMMRVMDGRWKGTIL